MMGCTKEAKKNAVAIAKGSMTYQQATSSIKGMTIATKAATVGLKALSIAGNMIVFTAIAKGIQILSDVFDELIETNEEYLEKQDEIISKSEETISSTQSEIDSLEELQEKIKDTNGKKEELFKLSSDIESVLGKESTELLDQSNAYDLLNAKIQDNINLRKQEQEEANKEKKKALRDTIKNTVIENEGLGESVTFEELKRYGFQGGQNVQAIFNDLVKKERNNEDFTNSVEEYAELWRKAVEKAQANMPNAIELGLNGQYDIFAGSIPSEEEIKTMFDGQLNKVYSYFEDEINSGKGFLSSERIKQAIKQMWLEGYDIGDISERLDSLLSTDDITKAWSDYVAAVTEDSDTKDILYNDFVARIDRLKDAEPYAENIITDYVNYLYTTLETAIDDSKNRSYDLFSNVFNAESFTDSAKALKELAISGELSPETLSSTKEYIQLLEETGLTAEEATERIRQIALGESSLSTIMSEIQSTSQLINQVEDDLKDYGEITFSSLQSIADQFPSLEQNIRDYLNGIEGAEEELVSKLRDYYKQDLINYDEYYEAKQGNDDVWWSNFLTNSSDLVNKLKDNYDIDLANFSTYLLAKEKMQALIDENESKVDDWSVGIGSIMPDPLSVGGYYQGKADELKAYLEEIQNKFKDSIKSSNWEDTLDYTSGKKYDSSSSSSSSEKSFDWISIATKRADEELDTLNDKISDTYATWEERTQALKDAFDRVTNSIELQNQAATAYMEEANKIQLPESYKTLIKNGALTAKDVVDSDLADKISEYQTLYEKSIECTKTAEELQNTLNEIATSKQWDLIKNQFSASLDEVDFRISEIQNAIDILEMKGLYADEKYYNDMIALTQKKKATLESEMTQLQSIMSNMTPGTEAYNKMFSELMDIRTEVSGLEKDIVDFNKTIRDLNWEVFEYLEESINRITDETEYLVGLLQNKDLFDKNGNRTNYGDATIGLHAIAYETYKQQAQDYLEEANKLQKELVAGAGKDVLEQYNKMIQVHRDAVNSALDEKNAILDLIEDGYNAQLDAIQELIDKKKEQLNAEKNLYDYQKNLKKQSDNISNLEKQQIAYNGDNSEEAMAKAQQLKVQLEDARNELQETEYEQYLSDTQNMLDTLSTEFETWINERLDNSDMLFEQTIEQISMQGSSITDTLNSIAAENNTIISDSLLGITSSMDNYSFAIQEAIQKNMETTAQLITESNTSLTDSVSNSIGSSLSITNGVISDAAGSIVSAENGTSSSVLQGASSIISAIGSLGSSLSSSIYSMGSTIASSVSGAISGIKADVSKNANNISSLQNSISSLRSSLDALSSRVSSLQSNSNNSGGGKSGSVMHRENLSQVSTYYANGTPNAKKGLAWTQEDGQEYIITKDGALLTNLSGGELVLNNKASKLLYDFANSPEEFLRNMPSFVPNINLPSLDVPNSFREQKVDMKVGDITISLPNVTNYAEFRNELIKDKDFEKSILTTVNNAAMGKSTISKLKYVR